MTAPTGDGSPAQYPYKTPRWILWVVGLVSVAAVVAAFVVGPNDGGGSNKSNDSAPTATDSATATTQPPPTTRGPASTTTRPSTTAAPTTALPTTPPPTTAPPTTPPPPPPASATVVVSSCRVQGGALIATGTLTNTGSTARAFRAMVIATDRAGRDVTAVAVDVAPVTPRATVPFTISKDIDAQTSSRVAACRAGGATPL